IDIIQVTITNNTQHPRSSSLGELLGAIRSLSRTTPAGPTHLSPLERSKTHPLPWRIPQNLSLEGIVNLTQPNKSRLSLEDVTAPLSLEEALSTHSAVLGGSAGSFKFYLSYSTSSHS
ncbi:hypothetical protein LINPERHAP1_LOCUS12510, partial [Linum perenne]